MTIVFSVTAVSTCTAPMAVTTPGIWRCLATLSVTIVQYHAPWPSHFHPRTITYLSAMEETVEGSMVVIGSVEQRREQTSQQQLHSSTGITAPADDGREEW